jgi:cytochrome b subunit of formate dehydrogenase
MLMRARIPGTRILSVGFLLTTALAALEPTVGGAQEMGEQSGSQTAALAGSVHRMLMCSSCHAREDAERHMGGLPEPNVICIQCHADQAREGPPDEHRMAVSAGNARAPTCVTCHGSHDVRSRRDPASPTFPANVVAQCAACHATAADSLAAGVHASERAPTSGLQMATCTSCHTAHRIARPMFEWSTVAPARIASTCAECHTEAGLQYAGSVHARAAARGAPHAGTCTDCHGRHEIQATAASDSSTSASQGLRDTCSACHESVQLTEMHRLPASVVQDYRDSFHGLAGALGDRRVARCSSCHGNHDVRPSWDPQSRINPANLTTTCGECHSGAVAGFARGGIHHLPRTFGHRLVDASRAMYRVMIVGIIGLMLLHNVIDFRRRWKDRAARRGSVPAAAHAAHRVFLRFTCNERVQHWTVAVSFIVLAASGFALRFGWALPWVSASVGVSVRAVAHRVAAGVFIGVAIYHLGYLAFTNRGRQVARDMVPRLTRLGNLACCALSCLRLGPPSASDWRDLVQMVKYNLGLTPARPQFGRFTYAEKMEYFALLWGTVVMVVSGLALWFAVPFLNRFPYWSFDLATVVHYYEAILATLSIVVWHFYFTIFNPEVFPVSKAMVTGDLSREEMQREHERELCAIEEAERLQAERLPPPASPG